MTHYEIKKKKKIKIRSNQHIKAFADNPKAEIVQSRT